MVSSGYSKHLPRVSGPNLLLNLYLIPAESESPACVHL